MLLLSLCCDCCCGCFVLSELLGLRVVTYKRSKELTRDNSYEHLLAHMPRVHDEGCYAIDMARKWDSSGHRTLRVFTRCDVWDADLPRSLSTLRGSLLRDLSPNGPSKLAQAGSSHLKKLAHHFNWTRDFQLEWGKTGCYCCTSRLD